MTQPDTPDATVNLTAELRDGTWTLFAVPQGAHTNDDRLSLGSGRSGTGIMFPVDMLEMFAGVRS